MKNQRFLVFFVPFVVKLSFSLFVLSRKELIDESDC
jgi:hypothetical protein